MPEWVIVEDTPLRAFALARALRTNQSTKTDRVSFISITDSKPEESAFLDFEPLDIEVVHAGTIHDALRLLRRPMNEDSVCLLDIKLGDLHKEDIDRIRQKTWLTGWIEEWLEGSARRLIALTSNRVQPVAFLKALEPCHSARILTIPEVSLDDYDLASALAAANTIVNRSTDEWQRLNSPLEAISFDEFLNELEKLSHKQIQKEGKANRLLNRFLQLTQRSFEEHFCCADEANRLTPAVSESLKSLAGVTSTQPRQVCLRGAWLLALGIFRAKFPGEEWTTIFNVGDINKLDDAKQAPRLHPKQTARTRRNVLQQFYNACEALFEHRVKDTCVLSKVSLSNGKLTFLLDFPCVSGGSDSLQERILAEALTVAGINGMETGHDSSSAIWKLCVAMSISDVGHETGSALLKTGCTIRVVSKGQQTEVIFGHGT